MITKGNRQGSQPVYINASGSHPLERIPLESKSFSENFIQQLIYDNPSILPIADIERSFGPLVAVARELNTPVGPIDNVYISPEGAITIVETKLWRNAQARREVVGQILDYAKELSKWSYTDLDNAVMQSQSKGAEKYSMIDFLQKKELLDEGEHQYFIDNISKNLKRGRFLLLIVGDGIRESVEDMVDYLSLSPQLHFTLALVELQVYKHNEVPGELIIIPHVVTRTKEITRAVVRIEGNLPKDIVINIETDISETVPGKIIKNKSNLSIPAGDFFQQLLENFDEPTVQFARQIIADAEANGFDIIWNSGSFAIKLPDPQGSGIKISLLNIDRKGLVYLGYATEQFKKLGLPLSLNYAFAKDTAQLLPGVEYNTTTNSSWNTYGTLQILKPVYKLFLERIQQYVNDIKIAGE